MTNYALNLCRIYTIKYFTSVCNIAGAGLMTERVLPARAAARCGALRRGPRHSIFTRTGYFRGLRPCFLILRRFPHSGFLLARKSRDSANSIEIRFLGKWMHAFIIRTQIFEFKILSGKLIHFRSQRKYSGKAYLLCKHPKEVDAAAANI